MITAILNAGMLEGKMKLPKLEREIEIILPVMKPFDWGDKETGFLPTLTPRAKFVWYKQISRYKHVYKLQEIL
jgi:hypothetical protein